MSDTDWWFAFFLGGLVMFVALGTPGLDLVRRFRR